MDTTEARTTLYHLHESDRIVEAAYEESLGEVTPEVSAIEHLKGLAVDNAAEVLAGFIASVRATQAAVKTEQARLAEMKREAAAAEAWAIVQIGKVLVASGKKKIQAGTFSVSTRMGSKFLSLPDGFNPKALPAECLRHKPETWEVDKVKARKWVEDFPDEDHGGASVQRGPDSVSVK